MPAGDLVFTVKGGRASLLGVSTFALTYTCSTKCGSLTLCTAIDHIAAPVCIKSQLISCKPQCFMLDFSLCHVSLPVLDQTVLACCLVSLFTKHGTCVVVLQPACYVCY